MKITCFLQSEMEFGIMVSYGYRMVSENKGKSRENNSHFLFFFSSSLHPTHPTPPSTEKYCTSKKKSGGFTAKNIETSLAESRLITWEKVWIFSTLVYINTISEISSLKISKSMNSSLIHHQKLLFKLFITYKSYKRRHSSVLI